MAGPETHIYSVGNITKDPRSQAPFDRFTATAGFIAFFPIGTVGGECIFIIRSYFSPFNMFNFFLELAPAFISRDFKNRITRPWRRPLITFTSICALLVIPESCDPAAVCVQDNDVTPVLKNVYFSSAKL